MSRNLIRSPCLGMCSTTYGDLICRGCRRSCTEISRWGSLDNNIKKAIVARLDRQIKTVMQKSVVIEDKQLLLQTLKQKQISHDIERSPWSWLLALLVKCSQRISVPSAYGFKILKSNLDIHVLTRESMQEMYRLATENTQDYDEQS